MQNHMILNPSKFHYMLLGGNTQIDYISLNNIEIKSGRNETSLGVILDNDLTFDVHIKCLCRKAAQKLSDLYRISKYLSYDQFQYSQFTYCPL